MTTDPAPTDPAAPVVPAPPPTATGPRVPEPGSPYHHLARSTDHRWYRPIGELLVLWVLVMAGGGLLGATFGAILPDRNATGDGASGLVMIGIILATPILLSPLAARVAGRVGGMLSSVIGRLRWRWLAWCVGIFVLTNGVAIGLKIVLELIAPSVELPGTADDVWIGVAAFLPQLAVILVIVPLQAAGEEYAFRGTLLQAIGAWVRPTWVPIAITSVAFAAMHVPEEPIVWIGLLSTGVVTAWLTIRTGGLEAAIALHVVGNVIGFSLSAAFDGLGSWATELNTDIPFVPQLITEVCIIAGALIVARRARRIGLTTTYESLRGASSS